MESKLEKVLSPRLLDLFKSYRAANIDNWDTTTFILSLIHCFTIENDFVRLKPDGNCTVMLEKVSNQLLTNEDGSRFTSITYMHRNTGLKKIFYFYETATNELSFTWKDHKSEQNDSVVLSEFSLPTHLSLKDLPVETLNDTFDIGFMWKLTTLSHVGMISECHKKIAYIKLAEELLQNDNEKEYFSKLRSFCISNYKVPNELEYLDRLWELEGLNSPLRFIGIHIHKVLVNYDSELKLCMQEEGLEKAKRFELKNGSQQILETFYTRTGSYEVAKLRITENGSDGTEGEIIIEFENQKVRMAENEYMGLGGFDCEKLWKFSVKVRVYFMCDQNMDKFEEILRVYVSSENPEKQDFTEILLKNFTMTLEYENQNIPWRNQLLIFSENSTDVFNEWTFFKIFPAECILIEGGLKTCQMLRKAWGVDSPGAIHLIAFYIHLMLITHPTRLKLLTATGPTNDEMVAAKNSGQQHKVTRFLEAEYQIPRSEVTKQLILNECQKDQIISAKFGVTCVLFYVHDYVIGSKWRVHVDNVWKWQELTEKVKQLLIELDTLELQSSNSPIQE